MKRVLVGLITLALSFGPAFAGPMTLLGAGKSTAAAGVNFVAGNTSNLSSATFAFSHASAVANDILIVVCNNNFSSGISGGVSSGGTALTQLASGTTTSGQISYVFWLTLTAGDLTTGTLTMSGADTNGLCSMAIYHGATTATFKSSFATSSGGTTLVFTGFAPSGSSKGVVAAMTDRTDVGTPTVTGSPATWTSNVAGSTTFFAGVIQLSLNYTNATTTFSGFDGTASQDQGGFLLEFT